MQAKRGKSLSYSDAGVDIDVADKLVSQIKMLAASTARPGATGEIGGFGGLFDPKAAGYEDPILVAATDGVGTKVKLAIETDNLETVGIDLVAMCVNDLLVQGAEPLFFLDYLAAGRLDPRRAQAVVAGIAAGCRAAGAALVGGETAEMPGLYQGDDFDLAGFAVGAVERGRAVDGSGIKSGDPIIGISSAGVHSNGFSLVRKIIEENSISLSDISYFDDSRTYGESLLEPTRIYVESLLPLVRAGLLKGLAHITGGGLIGNLPRVLPSGSRAELEAARWDLPPVFAWLRDGGNLSPRELVRTFNCGIGMAAIVAEDKAQEVIGRLEAAGERAVAIGTVRSGGGSPACSLSGGAGIWGFDQAWQVTSGAETG